MQNGDPVRAYLAKIGKKGGSVTSKRKAAACRANGEKGGRPRIKKGKIVCLHRLAGRGPSKARDPLKMAEAGRKGALARWGKRKKK